MYCHWNILICTPLKLTHTHTHTSSFSSLTGAAWIGRILSLLWKMCFWERRHRLRGVNDRDRTQPSPALSWGRVASFLVSQKDSLTESIRKRDSSRNLTVLEFKIFFFSFPPLLAQCLRSSARHARSEISSHEQPRCKDDSGATCITTARKHLSSRSCA